MPGPKAFRRAALILALLGAAGPVLAQDRPIGEPVAAAMPLGSREGSPLDHLPEGARLLSSFGERPAFSPDGRKLAFIGASYGDAFEIDLATGAVRNLTAHMPHKGFLRVQYLHDGSYLLLGPHRPGKTREETRNARIELWWLDPRAERPAVRLGATVFEGFATSPRSNLVAWAENSAEAKQTGAFAATTMKLGEIVVENGRGRLANVRTVLAPADAPGCMVEAQDFLPGDRGLTFPCYRLATTPGEWLTRVMGIDFATKRTTLYPTPPQLYGEVEGLFPDGRRTLVECSGDRAAGMDMCILELKPERPAYRRITRIMDFGRWKYGNPVVSPDGRWVAASIGSADVIDAGVGEGIVMLDLDRMR